MEWTKLIEDPAFSGLSTSEQNEVRQHWVDTVYVPELQKGGIPEEDIPGARYEALARYDNGQGYVSSFASSAAQGLLGLGTAAIQGAGVLTGSDTLEDVGTGLQDSVQENIGANPVLDKTNFTGQVLGNVAGFVGTAGAGGLIGKGLGAASLGAEVGGLGTGFLAGTGQGAQEADQYGITGEGRFLRALGGGLTEILSEKIPGLGFASELRAISKIPGLGSLATPGGSGFVGAVGSEIIEENVANTAGNALTGIMAPAGVETPGLFSGVLEATAGGALGGAAFGGLGMIGRSPSTVETEIDTTAATAEAALLAAGDPAAAAVIANANATRPGPMVPVDLPVVPEARGGDSSVGDLLVPPEQMDLAAFAAGGVPLIEEEEGPFDTSGAPFVLPPEAPADVNPPEGATTVQPPATEDNDLGTAIAMPFAPPAPAATLEDAPLEARTYTPEQIQQFAQDDQLIDTNGRINAEKATSIFTALKDLGVTRANLVINDTGVAPDNEGITRARGQRTMVDGQDTIFLNQNEVRLDTPLHEVVHGLVPEMRTANRALYDQGAAILQNSPLAEAIRRRYEAGGVPMDGDAFMEEVMTTAVANNGAELFAAYAGNGAMVRAIKEWLAKIRVWVEEVMGSNGIDPNMTVGEFSAKVNRRILAGKLREGGSATAYSAPAAAPTRFEEMLAKEDARRAAAAGDTPYRIDGIQKGYESDADDAAYVPKFQNVTIVDPTHPFNGSSLNIPVNGRPTPLTDAQIREAIEEKRNQRYSLGPAKLFRAVSKNKTDELQAPTRDYVKRTGGNARTLFGAFFSTKPNEGEGGTQEMNGEDLKLFDEDAYGSGPWDRFSSRGKESQLDRVMASVEEYRDMLSRKGYDGLKVTERGFGETVVVFPQGFGKLKPPVTRASYSLIPEYNQLAQDPAANEERLQEIVNQAADEAGYTIEGNHGTTHEFNVFDVSRGNVENDMGRGIYLTNNEDDVTENYAGEGPDLTNRIEQLAERLEQDEDEDGEPIDSEKAREMAREQLVGGTPRVIKGRIRMQNPVILDGQGSGRDGTLIELQPSFDSYYEAAKDEIISENPDTDLDDLQDEISERQFELRDNDGSVTSNLEKIRRVVDSYNDSESDKLMEALQDGDEIQAWELERELRDTQPYVTDEMGELAVGEMIHDVFEALGFDGIIDRNVSSKFGSRSRGKAMVGVYDDTEHYIVRDSAQVKSSAPVEYDNDGNVIPLEQRFDPNKRDIRYSLMRPTGLGQNQVGTPVRAMVAGMSYRGESFGPAYDQAMRLYMDVERLGGGFDAHLAQFNALNRGNAPGILNMTPGTYWGIMMRALTDVANDPNSDAMQVEEASGYLFDLGQIGVDEAASGGQYIKGFDGGLRIANNPKAQADMEDKMAAFDGSPERRKEFDKEKAIVTNELDELTTGALDDLTEEQVTRQVSEALADVAKAEDTSIAAELELDEELAPEIIQTEEAAEVSEGWLASSIGKLNRFLTKTSDKLIYHMQVLNGLQNLNGLFSLTEGDEPPPDVQKAWEGIKTKAERDALIKSTKAEIARLTKEITEIKSVPVSDAPLDDSATAEGMARQRITDNLERLLSPKAKKKLKATERKIASAISSAILSKSGLGGKQPGGADNMTFAMGLLLANQDKAATVLQQVHDIIQGDPETYDDISREKLKSFMEMTIGKVFDTAEGASSKAAPYGEKQIAAVLRSELKRMKVSMTKVAKDSAMARKTAAELEKALRDPKRGYAAALSPESLDKVINVVLGEYNRTAAERTQRYQQQEQLALDDRATRQMLKDAAKESRGKRAAYFRVEKKKALRELREIQKESDKAVTEAAKDSRRKRALTIRLRLKAIRKEVSKANRETRSAASEAAAESRRKRALAFRIERRKRQKDRRELVKQIRQARQVGAPVPDLTPLNYEDAQALTKQKPEKVIDYLAREFGFDLSEVVRTVRGADRQSTVEAMAVKLATDLNLSKAQAQAMLKPIITEAMKTVDARRKKEAQDRIATKVQNLSGRTVKKGAPATEAQRLIRLAELGGLSEENVEKVMLNSIGAKQFSPEFKADLERVIEQSNDPNLPQAARDELKAAYLGMIKSARGVYATGLLGEWTMSNIFMNLLSTMKVNAVWGGIKAMADNAVFIARLDPFNTTPGAQLPKGAYAALVQALRRGYTKDLQYQALYIGKTGRSKLESDYTTQFSNSDFETLAHFPATEIRLWQNGQPLSPFWASKVRLLTNFSKYTRRVMVGTDIFHRTPAYEMLKVDRVIKLIHERGGDIPNTAAGWMKAVDDAMYGGDFDGAKAKAFKEADRLLAEGKIKKDEYGIAFGEEMDKIMGKSLGLTDAQLRELLDGATEQAKRWTVANATEGVLGGLSNSMLNAVREIPGLKFLMPAIRMPIGAFSQGLDWSPYGFLRAQAVKWNKGKSSSFTNYVFNRDGVRKTWNLPAGGVPDERVLDLRNKAAFGTALAVTLYLLTKASEDEDEDKAGFYITGKGPEDVQKNKLWREKGNQPFTIRINGKYSIRFQESPAYPVLAALGAWSDSQRYAKSESTEAEKYYYAILKGMGSFADAAVLKNLQDVVEVSTGGQSTGRGVDKAVQVTTRLGGLVLFPRIGQEVNNILYGPQDLKAGGWGARLFSNLPFTPALFGKPALNFFGETIHEDRGGPMGEVMPMINHRVTAPLTDDPQTLFVSKMGANPLTTTRRFKDGTAVKEDYEFMREWQIDAGKRIRAFLTPERISRFEASRVKDQADAEKDFDDAIREIRLQSLKSISKGRVIL